MKRLLVPLVAGIVPAFILIVSVQPSRAGSATWRANPSSGDWNTAANWAPMTVPNGPSDTATFASSNQTNVSLSAHATVDGVVFNPGASGFTISIPNPLSMYLEGVGITNNSAIFQHFVVGESGATIFSNMGFFNSATAGSLMVFTIEFGTIFFENTSTAGDATFINSGGTVTSGDGGITFFSQSSSAANATLIVNGGAVANSRGGSVQFANRATAANATVTVNGSTASGAGGGELLFFGRSRGGRARVTVFGKGSLDISPRSGEDPGVTIGSLEGDGKVFLGAKNLAVGSNQLSTNFSGPIQDGGFNGGVGGSLTKIGTGKLVLTHRNTYTGGTTIKRGKLIVNNTVGSGTGSGPVQVDGGWLGGRGIIGGTVTVGTGSGSGAVLDPGTLHGPNNPGALTIESPLTFNADATYNVEVNSNSATTDEVIAARVTINAGAQFAFEDIGNSTLAIGTIFTIINNTSATPITGTFSNLPDGSIFSANGNTYQVSYEGGNGNDLDLTVVP